MWASFKVGDESLSGSSESGEDDFETQLQRLNHKSEEDLAQRLANLELQLFDENDETLPTDELQVVRDGVSYAMTTPASTKEWQYHFINLCVCGVALPTRPETNLDEKEHDEVLLDENPRKSQRDQIKNALVAELLDRMMQV